MQTPKPERQALFLPHTIIDAAEIRRLRVRLRITLENINTGAWRRHEQTGGIAAFWSHVNALQALLGTLVCSHPVEYHGDKWPYGMQCGLCEQPLKRAKSNG